MPGTVVAGPGRLPLLWLLLLLDFTTGAMQSRRRNGAGHRVFCRDKHAAMAIAGKQRRPALMSFLGPGLEGRLNPFKERRVDENRSDSPAPHCSSLVDRLVSICLDVSPPRASGIWRVRPGDSVGRHSGASAELGPLDSQSIKKAVTLGSGECQGVQIC
ncbi:hypothetical protein DPEC_G00328930 [Dallia pectoralis]|uniref:Uncharacterized protein n=1 Tax=Dallia pectoralis TaxID=75939 RepID=A0ACC2F8V0_DALPE|nr:hypothetical protein DPEC_G00328930 [Dallia pectoralis]